MTTINHDYLIMGQETALHSRIEVFMYSILVFITKLSATLLVLIQSKAERTMR